MAKLTHHKAFAALSAACSGALSLGMSASAQEAMTLTGEIEEVYGEDGFVMQYGETDVAIATGQLFEDNPRLRLSAGERVTVYALPTTEFFTDRVVDADGIYILKRDASFRVRDSQLGEDAYAMASGVDSDDAPSGEETLAAAANPRSTGEESAQPGAAPNSANTTQKAPPAAPAQAGPSEAEDFDEFANYDRNGDSVLTLEEYVRIAARPANVSRAEAVRLFEALARGDRLVTKTEFLNPSNRYERISERIRSGD